MTYFEEIIKTISCFHIQKVSNHGSLVLYQDRLAFVYDNGNEDKHCDFGYKDITQIKVDNGFLRAMDTLQIDANDRTFHFSGVNEIEEVKNLISLLKHHRTKPDNVYGFTKTGQTKVEWKDLDDPILLCSYSLPSDMATVSQRMLSKDFFVELYTSCGSEQIVIDEWSEKNGYQERTIHYQKTINIPFMGKSIIQIAEKYIVFTYPNKMAIQIVSDLGKTPYASCFDPQVQILFEDKGGTVEFLVKFKLVWSNEPVVKNIIDSKTTEANRIFYVGFAKQLIREVGGSDDTKTDQIKENENDEDSKNESDADEFAKMRKIYKAIIIILFAFLIISVFLKYRKNESYFFSFWKIFHLIIFLILLINF